jgi:hypothetical protein
MEDRLHVQPLDDPAEDSGGEVAGKKPVLGDHGEVCAGFEHLRRERFKLRDRLEE